MSEASAPNPAKATPAWAPLLVGAGLVYLALGVALAIGHFVVGMGATLFPTGWILPAVLLLTGALMTVRRRFDLVITVWAAFTLAVFLLGSNLYLNLLELGLDDATAFDASIMAAALALVPLVLRPAFRD